MRKGLLLKNIFLLALIVLLFTSCNDEEAQSSVTLADVAKTTETNTSKNHTYLLSDFQNRDLNIRVEDKKLFVQEVKTSLVLINLFASWCIPCKGQLPYLKELQKIHKDDLSIIGLLVNDSTKREDIDTLLKRYHINYSVSQTKANDKLLKYLTTILELPQNYTIPLSILYKDGKLFRYYEGAIPMEMLEIEIKNAQKIL